MAASSTKKLEHHVFTSTATSADAAKVRESLERKQKLQADTNLLTLRYMIETSRDATSNPRESFVATSAAEVTAELQHPTWESYDPLDKSEHIYRFSVPARCRGIIHMVNIIYTNIAQYLNTAISSRTMDAAWQQNIVDYSCGALLISKQHWDFVVPAYRELKFTAHQLLFADTQSAKLFIIVVNDTTLYDFFFYFF